MSNLKSYFQSLILKLYKQVLHSKVFKFSIIEYNREEKWPQQCQYCVTINTCVFRKPFLYFYVKLNFAKILIYPYTIDI